jgi:pimeloyl-ACP methyl ester carboxylesterase
MQIEVNGTRLWFDVDGPALVPDGDHMRERPTLVLVHGGPGGYDHSYFKPHFARLTGEAQVVYLDLRDHGRSARTTRLTGASRCAPMTCAPSATPSASSGQPSSATPWAAGSFCSMARATPATPEA